MDGPITFRRFDAAQWLKTEEDFESFLTEAYAIAEEESTPAAIRQAQATITRARKMHGVPARQGRPIAGTGPAKKTRNTYTSSPDVLARRAELETRADVIVSQHKGNLTLEAIGKLHNITRERVRQVLYKRGIVAGSGGRAQAIAFKHEEKRKDREERAALAHRKFIERWGMPRGDVATNPEALAYKSWCANVKKQGTPNALTFLQWKEVWAQAGAAAERGQGKYGMSRRDLTRGYDMENAIVRRISEISSEAITRTIAAGKLPLTSRTTHCKQGHERTPENTWVDPKTSMRNCIPCRKLAEKRYYEKQKAIVINNKLKG